MISLEYSDPQFEILESTAQRNLMQCGVGSGKSHVIGTISFEYAVNNPEVRGFIGANSYSQLTKSTLDRVFKVWSQFGLIRNRHYVVDHIPPDNFKIIGEKLKSYENTISFNNGALIFTASLDNYRMIDGTEFGWACLDETKDTKEEAVKEVIVARLRQIGMFIDVYGQIWTQTKINKKVSENIFRKTSTEEGVIYLNENGLKIKGFNPLYIFTSPSKSKWLAQWFDLYRQAEEIEKTIYTKGQYYRKQIGDKLVVIASSYFNQHNLSEGYLDRLISDLAGDQNRINMLIYGSPFAKTGGEFYHAFGRLKHVKTFEAWKDVPVHLSFDFNLTPYITCTCWQIKMMPNKRYLVRCFKEFCLPNPKNNAESLSKEIVRVIGHLLKNGIFIYGDYSGKTNDTINEEIRNEYEMIEKILRPFISNFSMRVTTNKLHVKRRDFGNKLLAGGFNVDIEINENCIETIADFEYVKENGGRKIKENITKNGKTFEEHGHTSDSADYFWCGAFENLFDQ